MIAARCPDRRRRKRQPQERRTRRTQLVEQRHGNAAPTCGDTAAASTRPTAAARSRLTGGRSRRRPGSSREIYVRRRSTTRFRARHESHMNRPSMKGPGADRPHPGMRITLTRVRQDPSTHSRDRPVSGQPSARAKTRATSTEQVRGARGTSWRSNGAASRSVCTSSTGASWAAPDAFYTVWASLGSASGSAQFV